MERPQSSTVAWKKFYETKIAEMSLLCSRICMASRKAGKMVPEMSRPLTIMPILRHITIGSSAERRTGVVVSLDAGSCSLYTLSGERKRGLLGMNLALPMRIPASTSPSRVDVRRDMTTAGHSKALKTRKAASKRFIKTGKGGLKRGKANKGHLTSKKSPTRKRRLNDKTNLTGTMLKKMSSLILSGK